MRHERINVGSAVAVEGGLLTVVQKDTDKATLSTIAARQSGDDWPGAGGPDQAQTTSRAAPLPSAIWARLTSITSSPSSIRRKPPFWRLAPRRQVPVVKDGELAIGTRMKVTISADHRVTDGAEAAQFLQRFKALMEQPMRLLV